MKRSMWVLVAVTVAFMGFSVQADTWKSLPLMDGHCIEKYAKTPDDHPRSCAMQCSKSGYGVITADGKFLKFDEAGNAKALDALKKSDRKDHLHATVEGTLKGDTIAVKSIAIE